MLKRHRDDPQKSLFYYSNHKKAKTNDLYKKENTQSTKPTSNSQSNNNDIKDNKNIHPKTFYGPIRNMMRDTKIRFPVSIYYFKIFKERSRMYIKNNKNNQRP